MARDATWTNSDGLVVGFGPHTEDNDVAAVYQSAGGFVTAQVEYTLADLPDTFAAANRKPQEIIIPRGSVIKNAWLHTLAAAVSAGGGTLDIGTWGTNDSADDVDGLVADATVAEIGVIGSVIKLDGPLVADAATAAADQQAVGTTSNSDVVLCASYETAVFTAGKVRLVVEYLPPSGSAGRTIAV